MSNEPEKKQPRGPFWKGFLSASAIFLIVMIGAGLFLFRNEIFIRSSHENEMVAESKQLYSCGMHPAVIQEGPGECPICGMNLTPIQSQTDESSSSSESGERIIKYWQAPMDPTYIRDEPGKSPMGMDLVPVYEDELPDASGGTIRINPAARQNMGVRTAAVERTLLTRVFRTVGHLDYDENTLGTVTTKISGWIEKQYVEETGAQVEKGDPLFEIYAPELVAAQEEYLLSLEREGSASSARSETQSLSESSRRKLEYWDISEEQIQELEETKKVKKTLTIYSRFTGIVTHKTAVEGMYVKAGEALFQMADLSRIWAYVHIYEYELPWIKEGQKVLMELPYEPGKVYEGTVSFIYPYLDKKTRDVKVRLEFPNPDLELKPEMYANVRIESELDEPVISIPEEAVLFSGERQIVFVAMGENRFAPREIKTGIEADGNLLEVLSGLKEGEVVVTSGQFMLDSESRLQEAIQKMLATRQTEQTG